MRISYGRRFGTVNLVAAGIRLRRTCNHESLADAATGCGLFRSFSFLHTNVE